MIYSWFNWFNYSYFIILIAIFIRHFFCFDLIVFPFNYKNSTLIDNCIEQYQIEWFNQSQYWWRAWSIVRIWAMTVNWFYWQGNQWPVLRNQRQDGILCWTDRHRHGRQTALTTETDVGDHNFNVRDSQKEQLLLLLLKPEANAWRHDIWIDFDQWSKCRAHCWWNSCDIKWTINE